MILKAISRYTEKVEDVKRIIFTMASPPSSFTINNAELRYDKDFVFSFRLDDGWVDAYRTGLPFFKGGNVVYLDGQTPEYPGNFYTDRCGNDIPFKASYCINALPIIQGNASNLDLDMVNEMYINGWDIFNHAHTPEVTFDWVYPISTGGSVVGNVITTDTFFTGIDVGDTIFNSNANDLAQNAIGVVQSFDEPSRTITLVENAVLPPGYTEFFPAGFSSVWGMKDDFRDSSINAQLDLAADAVRSELGIRMFNFTAPSNDELYDPITAARAQSGQLRVVNNIKPGERFIATDFPIQEWFDEATRVDGIGVAYDFVNVSDPIMTRTAADQQFIVDHLATMGAGENAWFTVGCHRINYREVDTGFATSLRYETFRDFFERFESTWGKSGDDSVWFAPINEVYEYWLTKENTLFSTVIEGNTVTITCNFAGVDANFRDHALSLLIDSDVDITNITYENFDVTSDNIGYSGDNTTALVNASYSPLYESAVIQRGTGNLLVSILEATQSQSDFDAAQNFVNTLPNGSFKDGLQARIDAVTVIPDSIVMQIDFGQSIGGRLSPFPWNNFDEAGVGITVGASIADLNSTIGLPSGIGIEIVTPPDGINGNTQGADGDSNNPFIFEATRDGFEKTTAGEATFRLTGLDPAKVYDFLIYGSRGFIGGTSSYSATGGNSDTTTLLTQNNGQSNTYATAEILAITPDGSNEIIFGYEGYLNVLQVTERDP